MFQQRNTIKKLNFCVGFLFILIRHNRNQVLKLANITNHLKGFFFIHKNQRLLPSRQ